MVAPTNPETAEICRTGKHFEQVIRIEVVCRIIFHINVDAAKEKKERRFSSEHEMTVECFQLSSIFAEMDTLGDDLPSSWLMQGMGDDSDLLQVGYGEVVQDYPENIEIQG